MNDKLTALLLAFAEGLRKLADTISVEAHGLADQITEDFGPLVSQQPPVQPPQPLAVATVIPLEEKLSAGEPVNVGGLQVQRVASIEGTPPVPVVNDRFPGRPNYVGPQTGLFGYAYHSGQHRGTLLVPSYDYGTIDHRLRYITQEKGAVEHRFYLVVRLTADDLPAGLYDDIVSRVGNRGSQYFLQDDPKYAQPLAEAVQKYVPDSVSGWSTTANSFDHHAYGTTQELESFKQRDAEGYDVPPRHRRKTTSQAVDVTPTPTPPPKPSVSSSLRDPC